MNLLVPLVIALLVASHGFTVDRQYIERWARSAGVELSPATYPRVRRYLTWSRRSRNAGGLTGFLIPVVYAELAMEGRRSSGWEFAFVLAGYLAGALFAEFVVNRRHGADGGALLVPRRLGDYLPGYVLVLQRGLGGLAPVLAAIYAIAPRSEAERLPDTAAVLAFGGVGIAVAVGIEFLQRRIVARRQTAESEASVAVDDAIRSSSLHVVAGAGLGVLLNIVGGELMVVGALTGVRGAPGNAAGWLLLGLGVLALVSSIAFWVDLTKPRGFVVRRGRRHGAAA